MLKHLLSLVLPLLAALAAPAQPADADPLPALRRALTAARTDTARGRLYWALSEYSESGDSTIYFAQRATPLLEAALPAARGVERQRLLRLLGGAMNNVGAGYSTRDEPSAQVLAHRFYRRAVRLRHAGGDTRGHVETLSNLANLHLFRSDYAGALRHFQQAVRVGARAPAARAEVALCLSGLGTIYDHLGDTAAQRRALEQMVSLLEQVDDTTALIQGLNQLAESYLYGQGDTARAERYARQAERLLARTPAASIELLHALWLRGAIRLRQRRFPQARNLLRTAGLLAARSQDSSELAHIQTIQAEVEERAGNLPLALRYARQAEATANQKGSIGHAGTRQAVLTRLYEQLGQPQAALDHYRRFIVLRDSLHNEENKQVAYRQRLSYEYERREASLKAAQDKRQAVAAAEIKRQKQLRYASSGGAVLLLLLAGVLFNRFRFQRRATAAITREKARSDELLLNILPAEVAEELKDTGKTNARQFDLVTVLFSDVVEFTQLSEKLTPQQLVATLDTYFGAFDAITGRFGLEKIKTIGDAYMLAGGLGQGSGADPAAVVRAALAMLAVVEKLRQEREPKGLPYFALRIGLHTGPVVAGVVGVKKFAYDIWGDTVNTAARIESSGAAGKVNISEDTYALVGEQFECVARGKLAAKHKGEIAMYFVERERVEAQAAATA